MNLAVKKQTNPQREDALCWQTLDEKEKHSCQFTCLNVIPFAAIAKAVKLDKSKLFMFTTVVKGVAHH